MKKKHVKGRGPLQLMEEAVHLLRQAPLSILGTYYIGSLPFALGLLYFWAEMSRSAIANRYCAPYALGLALLFIWMKCWQVVFAVRLKNYLTKGASSSWQGKQIFNLIAQQTFYHGAAIVILPVSLIMTVPFVWSFAFFQNITVLANGEEADVRDAGRKAWKQAKFWPGQNILLLILFTLIGLVVWMNTAIYVASIPYLLQKLFGIETVFVLSGYHLLNTTFLAVTAVVAYFSMDPMVKAVYVLRCFYGTSVTSGDDLRSGIKSFLASSESASGQDAPAKDVAIKGITVKVVALACLFFLSINGYVAAAETGPTNGAMQASVVQAESVLAESVQSNKSVDPDALAEAVDEVLQQRRYAWRMAREKEVVEEQDELPGFVTAVIDWLGSAFKYCVKIIKKIYNWIQSLFPDISPGERDTERGWSVNPKTLSMSILAVLIGIALFLLIRFWQSRKKPEDAPKMQPVRVLDITREEITAEDAPVNSWLLLAAELMEKKEIRLAVRALYLAVLAHLGEQGILKLARFKTNQDYLGELSRRAHEDISLRESFSDTIKLFDRTWYGKHELTDVEFASFTANHERIMSRAGSQSV